jgi:hypothetical protein
MVKSLMRNLTHLERPCRGPSTPARQDGEILAAGEETVRVSAGSRPPRRLRVSCRIRPAGAGR